jgi:peptidoglycan hydrolase-like protein with peptidoglycan-binding domain
VVAIVVVALLGAAVGVWGLLRSGSPNHTDTVQRASSLVTITERTLASQQQVSGTLGFAGASTVLQPVGTAPAAVDQADQQAAAAEQGLAQAVSNLSAAQARTAVVNAELGLAAARSAAASAHASAASYGPTSVYTMLPAVGQVLTRAQPLFAVSAEPVPLLYGSVTLWRAFFPGMSAGPDVAELNQNLADLGYGAGLAGSDAYTGATAAAVRTLQRALGLLETGQLPLGSVVFEPGPSRVTAVTAKLGAAVQAGAPVLDITSTTRQVTVQLDAAQQSQVNVGDRVVITLPDKHTTPATVTAVGTVAQQPPSSEPGAGSGSNSAPTINVDITPTDSAATGNLDAAPVQVSITTASVDHALVVPVTALLALSGGGYGVDVVSAAGAHQLVAVTLGLFDDAEGLVQVSGPDIHAGQTVAAAGS